MSALVVASLLLASPRIAPPARVETRRFWADGTRSRYMLVEMLRDADAKDPLPVVVVSPEIGGNRDSYKPVAEQLADSGFFVVVLTHPLSNCSAVSSRSGWNWSKRDAAMGEIAADPDNAEDRVTDVFFALERLAEANVDDAEVRGHPDLGRVELVGVGIGATTALRTAARFVREKWPWTLRAVVAISDSALAPIPGPEVTAASLPPTLVLGQPPGDSGAFFGSVRTEPRFRAESATIGSFFFATRDAQCGNATDFTVAPWALHTWVEFSRAFLDGDVGARDWLDKKSWSPDCGDGCRSDVADHRK